MCTVSKVSIPELTHRYSYYMSCGYNDLLSYMAFPYAHNEFYIYHHNKYSLGVL